MRTLAGWCVRHRRIVVLLWLLVLVGSFFIGAAGRHGVLEQLPVPPHRVLRRHQPAQVGGAGPFGRHGAGGLRHLGRRQASPTRRSASASTSMVAPDQRAAPRDGGHEPLRRGGQPRQSTTDINADQTVGFFQVHLRQAAQRHLGRRGQEVRQHGDPHVGRRPHGGGHRAAGRAGQHQSFSSTGLGVLLALVVLLLVFGSFFAALLPIISALLRPGDGLGVIGVAEPRPGDAVHLARADAPHRAGRRHRLRPVHRDAAPAGSRGRARHRVLHRQRGQHLGRAVLFAGIIVCIALLGMFAIGVSFLYGLAVAAAVGVALTMVAALTLLPAMLGFIGPKVMSRKQKKNLAENGPRIVGADSKGFWPNWADRVQRMPVAVGGGGAPGRHRGPRPALLLAPTGVRRPGNRPGRHADPGGLRHAGQGVRPGLHRTAHAGRRGAARPAAP